MADSCHQAHTLGNQTNAVAPEPEVAANNTPDGKSSDGAFTLKMTKRKRLQEKAVSFEREQSLATLKTKQQVVDSKDYHTVCLEIALTNTHLITLFRHQGKTLAQISY